MYNGSHAATFTSAAYLSTPADSHYIHHERPIQDIVTSGPFNFLQESEIETAVATGAGELTCTVWLAVQVSWQVRPDVANAFSCIDVL